MPPETQGQPATPPPFSAHLHDATTEKPEVGKRLVSRTLHLTDESNVGALPFWSLVIVLGEIALRLERREAEEDAAGSSQTESRSCAQQGDVA